MGSTYTVQPFSIVILEEQICLSLGLIGLLGEGAEAARTSWVHARHDETRCKGGNGTLGYWNLYGRLLNERGYTMLDTRVQLQEADSFGDPWSSVHFRAEGGSIANTDAGNGNLSNFRLSQVYLLSGNNIPNLIWQLGTLESYFGDLGLYDMRPAMVFTDTVGISGRYQTERSGCSSALEMGMQNTEQNTIPFGPVDVETPSN